MTKSRSGVLDVNEPVISSSTGLNIYDLTFCQPLLFHWREIHTSFIREVSLLLEEPFPDICVGNHEGWIRRFNGHDLE
jgi:hypothetical protein